MAAKGLDHIVGAACENKLFEPADSVEYIQHHLANLTLGKLPYETEVWTCNKDTSLWDAPTIIPMDTWTFAHGPTQAVDMGFWAFHVDSLGWSVFLGWFLLACSAGASQNFLHHQKLPPAYKILLKCV